MSPASGNIRNYFQPLPQSPKPTNVERPSQVAAKLPASQLIIKSSDDEESNSDSSLEDLTALLQFKSNTSRTIPAANGVDSSRNHRGRRRAKGSSTPTSLKATKPKYKFDMKMLIDQAENEEATEASAKRLKELLEGPTGAQPTSESGGHPAMNNAILESVISEQEGASVEKILQAVKRTEAINADKMWFFFNQIDSSTPIHQPIPVNAASKGWIGRLADPPSREQMVLSGFVKDIVCLGGTLPDELFLWILDELCLEHRDDMRESYFRILAASPQQSYQLMQPNIIMNLFQTLGGRQTAVDIRQKVRPTLADQHLYEGRDWSLLRTFVAFLGRISDSLSVETCSYTICVLARLCIDTVVSNEIGLLAAVQKTVEQISTKTEVGSWEKLCQQICVATFEGVEQATLRYQILKCMPQTTPRVHDLRRRLALAFFFEDGGYANSPAYRSIDFWDITKRLNHPQFNVNNGTDYYQLGALMSILDIAVDNGLSVGKDITDIDSERDFNADVDALAARIKQIWSSINDAGASYMSRTDTKEIMEGLRQRLVYAVRTKPRPKKSIFDSAPDDTEVVRKQSELMHRIFKKVDADET